MSWDTDGCTTISNAGAEISDVSGLMLATETHVVVLAVNEDVLLVLLGQLLNSCFDELHSARLTHLFRAEVGVASGTIPVTTWLSLGVEGDADAPHFGDTDQEVTSHPELITHGDTLARTDLEFPLRGHDLSVDSADSDASVEASTVVSLDEVTSKDLASTLRNMARSVMKLPRITKKKLTSTTVVRSLRTWETTFRPSVRSAIQSEDGVLLFETKPGNMLLGRIHHFLGIMTVIGLVGGSIVVVSLGKDDDIVSTTEGVLENPGRSEVCVGVVTRSLTCR